MNLAELSRTKGFVGVFNVSVNNSSNYYFWMCEIQQWLREKHNIFVEVLHDYPDLSQCQEIPDVVFTYYIYSPKLYESNSNEYDSSYNKIFEIALIEALKLVK